MCGCEAQKVEKRQNTKLNQGVRTAQKPKIGRRPLSKTLLVPSEPILWVNIKESSRDSPASIWKKFDFGLWHARMPWRASVRLIYSPMVRSVFLHIICIYKFVWKCHFPLPPASESRAPAPLPLSPPCCRRRASARKKRAGEAVCASPARGIYRGLTRASPGRHQGLARASSGPRRARSSTGSRLGLIRPAGPALVEDEGHQLLHQIAIGGGGTVDTLRAGVRAAYLADDVHDLAS